MLLTRLHCDLGTQNSDWRPTADALPTQYPAVKALLFFNATSDQTVTYQQVDWSIGGDAALARGRGRDPPLVPADAQALISSAPPSR